MSSERAIHQLVHGYDRGHRLLAGSTSLSEDLNSIISRASDAAPGYRPSAGTYLTGYGLPDGSWALARTWPAVEAERPNTVWTHTLIVPPEIVGRISASGVARHHRDPTISAFDEFRHPISVEDIDGRPATTTPEAARAVAAVYCHSSVVVPELEPDLRESAALAVWDQHWVSIRRTLSFCTAPDVRLFENSERALLFASASPPTRELDLPSIVCRDLSEPGIFRDWVHFVGSGERDPSLMRTFAEIYMVLTNDFLGRDELRQVETLLVAAGPDIEQLRRLKRRLLSFDGPRPRWSGSPNAVFEALANGPLGEITSSDDASLNDWLKLAWQSDASATAAALAELHRSSRWDDEGTVPPTSKLSAKDALASVFGVAVADLITPSTVETVAALAPHGLLGAVVSRNEPELWRAWAALPDVTREATVTSQPPSPPDWSIAVRGVRGNPNATRALLGVYPQAVRALVDELAHRPTADDLKLYPIPKAATRILKQCMAEVSDSKRIRAVSYLASPEDVPKRVDCDAWAGVLRHQHDAIVAAVAYLVGRRSNDVEVLELAALAVGQLYGVLATTPAPEVWRRLDNCISGDRSTWDRCSRLIADFSKTVNKKDNALATQLIGVVHRENSHAGVILAESFSNKHGGSLFKSVLEFFRW